MRTRENLTGHRETRTMERTRENLTGHNETRTMERMRALKTFARTHESWCIVPNARAENIRWHARILVHVLPNHIPTFFPTHGPNNSPCKFGQLTIDSSVAEQQEPRAQRR